MDASRSRSSVNVDAPNAEERLEGTGRGSASVVHEPGKSLLPFSRVQKIIKADKVRVICAVSA
jgi:hypothetical protein